MARILDEAGNMPHHQCSWCNEFTYGPHKGENPGYQVLKVEPDPETGADRFVSNDEARDRDMSEAEKNVSHGGCGPCGLAKRNEWEESHRRRLAEREAKAAREAKESGSR